MKAIGKRSGKRSAASATGSGSVSTGSVGGILVSVAGVSGGLVGIVSDSRESFFPHDRSVAVKHKINSRTTVLFIQIRCEPDLVKTLAFTSSLRFYT